MRLSSSLTIAAITFGACLLVGLALFTEGTEVRKLKEATYETCRGGNKASCLQDFADLIPTAQQTDILRGHLPRNHPAVIAARNGLRAQIERRRIQHSS